MDAKRNLRWSYEQTKELIDAVLITIDGKPSTFEAPSAADFYDQVCYNSTNPLFRELPYSKLKSRMRYMKVTYTIAFQWMKKQGLSPKKRFTTDSVKEHIEKVCPFYDDLEKIFGDEKCKLPPLEWSKRLFKEYQIDSMAEPSTKIEAYEDDEPTTDEDDPFPHDLQSTELVKMVHHDEGDFMSEQSMSSTIPESHSQITYVSTKKRKYNEDIDIELEKQKLDIKRLELEQQFELKKLELERDERIAMARMKLELEMEEKVKKYEIDLKYKSSFLESI